MELAQLTPWKQRALFMALGFAVAAPSVLLVVFGFDFLPFSVDTQSVWCGAFMTLLGWMPWVAVAGVIALRIKKGKNVRAGSYLVGSLLPVTLLLGWMFIGPVAQDWSHRREFDSEAWRAQDDSARGSWPPRICMIDSLLSSGKLDRLTRPEVLELLGQPVEEAFPYGAADCDIHYYLGPERGLIRIDYEWLFINFNESGGVERYWLYRD